MCRTGFSLEGGLAAKAERHPACDGVSGESAHQIPGIKKPDNNIGLGLARQADNSVGVPGGQAMQCCLEPLAEAVR